MGFCGDAVKATKDQLETLFEIQKNIYSQRAIVTKARELTSSSAIEDARAELADVTGRLSEQRGRLEEVQRDIRRVESDVELVEKRLAKDAERLNQSSNPKDIAGIEHEIESLKSRLSSLEDTELELMEQRDVASEELSALEKQRDEAEGAVEQTKAGIAQELESLKIQNEDLVKLINELKGMVPQELVVLFDKKLERGAAVGKLSGSSCSACNMSLNSTAMAEINRVPLDELATCSECSAMLVRA